MPRFDDVHGHPLRLFPDPPASEERRDTPVPTGPRPERSDSTAPTPVVEIRASARRRKSVAAHWEGDTIVVVVPQRLPERERLAYAADLSARLIAARARRRPTDEALEARARELSARYLDGRAVPTSVRWSSRQQSRWGSCSPADGTIRISDRLRDVPAWVLDTVLVHELAHLLHPGHDAAFHELANRHPRVADADLYLAGYGLGLRAAAAPS